MELSLFLEILVKIWEVLVNIYHSGWFLVFKFLAGVYTLVLFVDIVLLLILRGVGGDIRVGLKGAKFPLQSKSKAAKKWQAIQSRLDSNNVSQYKVAILEADKMVDEVLVQIGYSGDDMTERLGDVTEAQIENINELRMAHEVRNKVIHDKTFVIDLEQAKRVLGYYEDYLKSIELF